MDDDPNIPVTPDDETPIEQPEDDSPRPSRLDRLIDAREHSEKEAERWSELENIGNPLPSATLDEDGATMPIPSEPPRAPDDTPTKQDTPPEGRPAIDMNQREAPPPDYRTPSGNEASEPADPSKRKDRKGRERPVPSFPHPTDRDYQPPVPPVPPAPPAPGDSAFVGDEDVPFHLPAARQPADDAPGTPSGHPTSSSAPQDAVPQQDFDGTMVGPSAYKDEIGHDSDMTMPHKPMPRVPGAPKSGSRAGQVSGERLDPAGQNLGYDAPQRGAEVGVPRGGSRGVPPPSSYSDQTQRGRASTPPPPPQPSYSPPPVAPVSAVGRTPEPAKPKKTRRKVKFNFGCITRMAILGFVAALVLGVIGTGAASVFYVQVTQPVFADITSIDDLQERSLQFETTRIRDREGNILYQINDPEGGLRDTVSLEEVSPWIIVATVSTEERDYFTNPGFSIPAIIRAVVQNYREGAVVSGASTITQQVTRQLLLPDEFATERSYRRKITEIFLAAELNRRFTKEEILELYLNQIYYSNLSYGIEAASRTYFDKSASDLTFAEAAFLAGIPQAPAVWDPVYNPEAIIEPNGRLDQVLGLMLEAGCIDPGSSGLDLPCVYPETIAGAAAEVDTLRTKEFQPVQLNATYPHWVVYIQQLLEADPAIGPAIYTSGYDVYTTLDPRMQDLAQQQVTEALAGLTDRNVNNASVMVLDVDTGAILAMIGSADFDNEAIDGQVNIALTPQQPGSSIKPFTYLTSFEQGWTPETVIWDVPISYEIPGFGVYEPVNYDGRYHGPQTVRYSLANSYNVPAVLALDHVGVPALLQTLNDLGITSLGDSTNPNQYGLSLTLGAGEVYLIEWVNAFATIANHGQYHPLYAIDRIEQNGQVIEGYPYQVPEGVQVVDEANAYLISDILSDYVARVPAFGENSILNPPFQAAAKTGTTNDFRDNWTMGFTSEIAVGVWVGNTDNSPMINVTGVTGAGPIWRGVIEGSSGWYPPQDFARPTSIFLQTVCADDGTSPASDYCNEFSDVSTGWFAIDQPPPSPEEAGLYRTYPVDQFTGLIANEYCSGYVEERPYLVLPNPSQIIDVAADSRNWLLTNPNGQTWAAERGLSAENISNEAPTEECGPDTPVPNVVINEPGNGSTQQQIITIYGTAFVPNFSHYTVEYGIGDNPDGWTLFQGRTSTSIENNVLAQLDARELPDGPITLRLLVYDNATPAHVAEARVTFTLQNPTPTPTPTNAPTATPADTATPAAATPTATTAPVEPTATP